MPQSASHYASAPTLVGVPLPSKARTALVLAILLSAVTVLAGLIAFVHRPSKTTALFTGTGANEMLVVRVYNRGGLPSIVEPRAKLQFRAAGMAP